MRRAVIASRSFFVREKEVNLIRPLAEHMSYIPPNARVVHAPSGLRLEQSNVLAESAVEFEGLKSACTAEGYVRGMRIPFPIDGPSCKYAALFDPRHEFDALREAFMIYGDPASKANTFLKKLQEALQRRDGSPMISETILALQAWAKADVVNEPVDFRTRAWDAYLACVAKSTYNCNQSS